MLVCFYSFTTYIMLLKDMVHGLHRFSGPASGSQGRTADPSDQDPAG